MKQLTQNKFLMSSYYKYLTSLNHLLDKESDAMLNTDQGKPNFFHIQLTGKSFDPSNRTTKDLARSAF